MPDPNPEALEFLLARRSLPARLLAAPVPDRATLRTLLRAAARTPDHGKLEPWRFIVLEDAARARLAALTLARGAELGLDPAKLDKARAGFADSPLIVAVVASPKPADKVPRIEQELSAGTVCLGLLNAAQAAGFGANWLSGWMAHDRAFLTRGLNLRDPEWVAGFIHIGTATATPPDRPRPDIDALTTWMTE